MFCLGTRADASSAFQDDPTTTLQDVVVEGRTLQRAVEAFADEVADPVRDQGPARWDRQVCVGVANLRHDAAQVLIDRVSDVATSVGLVAGEPGCRANVLVIAANDARSVATELVDALPRTFRPGYSGASQSQNALRAFQRSDARVRWWPVSVPVDRETGQVAVRIPGRDPPILSGSGLLTTNVSSRLLRVIVIVDLDEVADLTLNQLADYIAMVSLAQVSPDADTSTFDTILNLFAENRQEQALTGWDLSYLRSLYGALLNQRNPNAQLGAVETLMVRDRRADGAGGNVIEP